MDEQFDTEAFMMRVGEVAKEVRRSEAYPAIVGAIAGGIAGALVAAIIAGRGSARREELGAKESGGGWSPRDIVQLVAVVAALARQVQAWLKEQERK
jgi:hypothetical protein